jgi:hypothetical protein
MFICTVPFVEGTANTTALEITTRSAILAERKSITLLMLKLLALPYAFVDGSDIPHQ